MSLSERDRKLLNEIECGIRVADPTWHNRMDRVARRRTRPLVSAAILLLGLTALIGGDILGQANLLVGVLVSVGGFGAMVGAMWELSFCRPRSMTATALFSHVASVRPSDQQDSH